MSHFFAYLARMKYIKRWGLMRNTQEENIQEHSLQVAQIAHALCLLRNRRFGGGADARRACELALFHEAAEVITGDLATPIKYFDEEITTSYKRIENVASGILLNMLPEDLRLDYKPLLLEMHEDPEWPRVKAADKLCAYLKCVQEIAAGNAEFSKAIKSIKADIDERAQQLPEVGAFLEEFCPSFSLTLDELN